PVRPGPIFADLVLADEINRAPAKTVAALLEAMQERTVTVDGVTHPLSATFTVFATQNPIEFEGTYPLPEAELDRFMVKVIVDYPSPADEQGILARYVAGFEADRPATYGVSPVTNAAGLERLRASVEAVRVEPQIMAYLTAIVRAALAALGILGFWVPRALDAMLLADVALLAAVWFDARRAIPLGSAGLTSTREAPPAFSVGRTGEVSYRWVNATRRWARLRVREVRPDLLGGTQPPRELSVPPRGERRETLAVVPRRRAREQAGAFVVESIGPVGLGVRRGTLAAPWDAAVYPPLVRVRLRASVARAARRQQGVTPIRQLGEGRLFESLREWVPGDDLRHIDWKATAKRRKVITRQYEAERRQQVLLVLDTGRLLTAEIAGVSRLDY